MRLELLANVCAHIAYGTSDDMYLSGDAGIITKCLELVIPVCDKETILECQTTDHVITDH